MHATLLRLRCAPGQATEVARLISAEYLPRIAEVEGVLSYTLVHSGQDEVASIGVFTSQAGAMLGQRAGPVVGAGAAGGFWAPRRWRRSTARCC